MTKLKLVPLKRQLLNRKKLKPTGFSFLYTYNNCYNEAKIEMILCLSFNKFLVITLPKVEQADALFCHIGHDCLKIE